MQSEIYKTYGITPEANRLIIVTDIHNCRLEWHGVKNEERMELLCKSLSEEYERRPYDAILSLGDYSLDFWAWNEGGSFLQKEPISNTEHFVKKYMPRLPKKLYMIPGNHEQYGKEAWESITGYPREYLIEYGNTVFVMLDTFGKGLDPDTHHDGIYSGINVDLLNTALKRYEDKRIILCAHDICISAESEEARGLISEGKSIVCAFTGHTHRDNTVILPPSWRSLPVFYSGDFSYNTGRAKERNWGYRALDISGDSVSTEYIKVR